jgi:hypothetical protein
MTIRWGSSEDPGDVTHDEEIRDCEPATLYAALHVAGHASAAA